MRNAIVTTFLALACSASLHAQDFAGQLLVATFNPAPWHPRTGTPGGLFVVHPRSGSWTQVAGLPLELTGAVGPTVHDVGINAMLVLPDGDLLLGESTPPTGAVAGVDGIVEVHRLRLAGGAATVIASYAIGSTQGGSAAIAAMDLLPDGNVLMALNGSLQAPLNGAKVVALDPASGTVRRWSLTGFPGASILNTLVVERGTVHLGEFAGQPPYLGRVYSAPLPSTSGSRTLAAVPLTSSPIMGGCMSFDFDNNGGLIVGTYGAGGVQAAPPFLHRVDVSTGAVTDLLPNVSGVANAVLVEANTDGVSPGGESIFWAGVRCDHLQGGVTASLVPGASAPWGIVSGLAMLPTMRAFGTASACSPGMDYAWATAPNPGGLPLVGNATFSITVRRLAPSPLGDGWFALGLAEAAAPIPIANCANLLLDPPQLFGVVYQSNPILGSALGLPLPIPNTPALVGSTILVQSFHGGVVWTDIESSPGLRITIL